MNHPVAPSTGNGDSLKRDRGVRLIATYKFIKGSAGIVASVALGGLLATRHPITTDQLTTEIGQHLAGAWSLRLAHALASVLEPRHLRLATIALGFDGAFTLLEGWALHHGHWWGPWLVVVSTSTFIPFEIVALLRRLRVGRLAILLINVVIVVYLAWRAARGRRIRPMIMQPM